MKIYKVLKVLIITEALLGVVLSGAGLTIENPFINFFAMVFFLAPLLTLLHLLGKDQRFDEKKRRNYKVIFWFILLAAVVAFVTGGSFSVGSL